MSAVIGGEFEEPLLAVVEALRGGVDPVAVLGDTGKVVSMDRQAFRVPDRRDLPLLSSYAFLTLPEVRVEVTNGTWTWNPGDAVVLVASTGACESDSCSTRARPVRTSTSTPSLPLQRRTSRRTLG
ncbi:MAG: hypothetical protein ACRDUV_00805 [Pseudonocardiaceae bacterium]